MELKELDKFLKICRKHGVVDMTFEGIVVKLGDQPQSAVQNDDSDVQMMDELTSEQLMFLAVDGQK